MLRLFYADYKSTLYSKSILVKSLNEQRQHNEIYNQTNQTAEIGIKSFL